MSEIIYVSNFDVMHNGVKYSTGEQILNPSTRMKSLGVVKPLRTAKRSRKPVQKTELLLDDSSSVQVGH